MTVIGTATVRVLPESSGFTSGLKSELGKIGGPIGQMVSAGENAAAKLKGPGGFGGVGLALAGIGIAAAAFAVKSIGAFREVGGEVLKVQRYLGDSAEAASKWRFAAQQSGVDTATFTKSVGLLEKGLASGKVSLDSLGIASVDSHGKMLPMDNILLKIADKVKALPPGIDRITLAQKLFGKSGADMVPLLAKGAEGIKALGAEAQKYGLVLTGSNLEAIKKATAAHREQTAAMQGLQVQIGSQVLPVMTLLTKELTTGLLAVMPAITAIVKDGVVPVFGLLASAVGAVTSLMSSHVGVMKIVGSVIGSVMVPALAAWAAGQVAVVATGLAVFLLQMGSAIVAAAVKMGILTGSLEGGTVAMSLMGAATLAAYAGVGLVILSLIQDYQKMQSSAKSAAAAVVESAKSPQEATRQLTEDMAKFHKEMGGGVSILGLHLFATDSEAKAAAKAAAGYKASKEQLDKLTQGQQAAADAATTISDGMTAAGVAIGDLGGATKLTADQVQQLADSMKLDLSKATPAMTEQLTTAAQRLGVTSVATLRLADDNKILSDWTQDVTKKTSALNDALDSLIGVQVGADEAAIRYKQSLADLADKLKTNGKSLDINTKAGQDNKLAIDSLIRSTLSQVDADIKAGGTMQSQRAIIDAHVADLTRVLQAAGLNTQQIQALIAQYNLTPKSIDTIVTLNGANVVAQQLAGLQGQFQGLYNIANQLPGLFGGVASIVDQIASKTNKTANIAAAAIGGLPHFAAGGIVPGPLGAPQLIVAHGGEEVRTVAQQGPGVVVHAPVTVNPAPGMDEATVGRVTAAQIVWQAKPVTTRSRS